MSKPPISQPPRCCECDRTWREYAYATAEHLILIRRRETAIALDRNEDSLATQIVLAETRRQHCREVVRAHEAQYHGAGMTTQVGKI